MVGAVAKKERDHFLAMHHPTLSRGSLTDPAVELLVCINAPSVAVHSDARMERGEEIRGRGRISGNPLCRLTARSHHSMILCLQPV